LAQDTDETFELSVFLPTLLCRGHVEGLCVRSADLDRHALGGTKLRSGGLTLGILRGFGHTILRFDPQGIARASAITIGLICAIAGFITGKLKLSYLGAQAIKSSSPINPVAER
jgi:hypothetical protein